MIEEKLDERSLGKLKEMDIYNLETIKRHYPNIEGYPHVIVNEILQFLINENEMLWKWVKQGDTPLNNVERDLISNYIYKRIF